MLLRALVLVGAASLHERTASMLEEAGVHVNRSDGKVGLWDELARGGFDLLVAASDQLPQPWSKTVARVRDLQDRTEVVALTASSRPEERSALQMAGAFAVLHPDLGDAQLRAGFDAVLRRFREVAVSRLRSVQEEGHRVGDPASRSPAMQKLLDLANRVAAADTTLLLFGETGVGKEWLVRAIHAAGPRSRGEFVPVNCAAVPDALIESELFGHEAGAFTGATRSRRGAFEIAHGGTLLLDEIGDLPVHLQGKLLRALQERKIQRLGAERAVDVDVRIVAATNRDLQAEMARGTFRPDLFYRLSVVTLHIPPLRERREDIRALAGAYLEYFRGRLGRPRLLGFSEAGIQALESHPWPGNVRELVNTVERAVLLSDGERIESVDLFDVGRRVVPPLPTHDLVPEKTTPEPLAQGATEAPLSRARKAVLEAFEKDYLDRALQRHHGHLGDTAKATGVDPRTLYNKMRRYGLSREKYRPSTT